MSFPHRTAIVWFRRDLRLADHPALHHALQRAQTVIPVFIHAPEEAAPWAPGAAAQWWLHHSLQQLDLALRERGSRLIIRHTVPGQDSLHLLQQLIQETGATLLCWNRVYEPTLIARDTHIKAQLKQQDIEVSSHNAALLFEPWQIQNQQGKPFKVFTPYWRHCAAQLAQQPFPFATPDTMPEVASTVASQPIDALRLLPRIPWDTGLRDTWQPGERGAQAQLQQFIDHAAHNYQTDRDRPDRRGTSRLSPHLQCGEISPRQILAALTAQGIAAESYIRELGWREFSYHLLYHFPQTPEQSLDARFEQFPWQQNPAALTAWQRGQTGIPLVDAGMRELWHTGFMHNRVRMVVASFLTKNLRIHWREGARWFWDTLVDADLANNTQGWQWTAGCGADAAPYFRVFNPVLQAQRFDPEFTYIRQWLPELARLPNKWLPHPWQAPTQALNQAGVTLGQHYPKPIVTLADSREAALTAYAQLKTMNQS